MVQYDADAPTALRRPLAIIFRFTEISLDNFAKSEYDGFVSSLHEGRIAIVTDVGWDAVDAGSADNERCESVRRRRVVLTPRCGRPCTWGHSTSQGATEAKSRSPGRARYKP